MTDNLLKKIGIKLKFERMKKGFSQEELAEAAKISSNLVSLIERGKSNPTVETIAALSKALDISIEELINPKNIEL
ncbi:TPA: helix-turn-helix transcriptional regulator [Candidatus Galligastranaerophilus faecipullorum]|nr:helix-turn-helix transcriptional regulator [Candidatus Galligastranaerophilus faecipullorum]